MLDVRSMRLLLKNSKTHISWSTYFGMKTNIDSIFLFRYSNSVLYMNLARSTIDKNFARYRSHN